ncbi:hemolysin family protein [Corynebacterium halotolerans]|uniref:hemolysin family protein n=1 Tax=Corynebacterium halotolerans TaxID=225326 RepID=UPI003CF7503B
MTPWLLLLALLVLIAANFLFVAVEFAYLTVNRNEVRQREAEGDPTAAAIERELKRTSSNLSGAQLGITVSSLVAGFLTGPSVGALLTELFGLTGLARGAAIGIAGALAFVLVTILQMVFGELVPKNWAIAEPMKVSRFVLYPQRIFMFIFGWLVSFLNNAANWVLRLLGLTPSEEVSNARTGEELRSMVTRSGVEGTLDAGTAELVARSIEFGEQTAADVMTPRPHVTFLDEHSVQELIDAATETGHSRFPVSGESVDEIVGLAHFKHAVAVPFEQRSQTPVRDITVPATVVSDSMTLDPLLRELRTANLQLAVVVDEYGGTAGIVTLEDLIEEIVGEIDDEQDESEQRYSRLRDGAVQVSGLLRPDELGDLMDLELPEGEESETLGGLIAEEMDRLPEVGDEVRLDGIDHQHRDEDNLPTITAVILQVATMDSHRVDQILVAREDGHDAIGPIEPADPFAEEA